MPSTLGRLFLLLLISSSLSSCILAPIIGEVQELGISEGDRQRELNKSVKAFNSAIYWNAPQQALQFVADDQMKNKLKRQIRARRSKEKITETELGLIDYNEGSTEAEVEIIVKYFRIPQYIVLERIELQDWKFSVSTGWKIKDLRRVESEDTA